MRRRDFIKVIAGSATWPLAARAQQTSKLPIIGFLGANTASTQSQWTAGFVQRLRELGWIEGHTIAIEYRWAEGQFQRSPEMIAGLIQLKVDVIVTHGTANVLAAKQATSVIPIVFASAGDPVGDGLVASLARPGGNITGLSVEGPDVAAKRLELLREVVPGLQRVAILANVNNPITLLQVREAQAAARTLGLELNTLEIRRAEDIEPAIESLKTGVAALYLPLDPLLTTNQIRTNTLALGARLATMAPARDYVNSDALMSYGANITNAWRRAADFVDKILRGAKPADIPVEQPNKFDLAINLTTARVLGLTIPDKLLAIADEVIE